jgi:catechol 1,2-dioxygenase
MNRKTFLETIVLVPMVAIAIQGLGKSKPGRKACKTQRDQEGPYYKSGAPERALIETKGAPLRIEGTVLKADDCQTPVSNAIIDVWHCDDDGTYDMEGFKGRGQVKTDKNGHYSFSTIYPPPYGNRPRHIHFKVRASGHAELTTQLYFDGDPHLRNDFARNATQDRVIALTFENKTRAGRFDLYI